MIRNIIFDFGGVLCKFNREYILSVFWKEESDRNRLGPVIYRDWGSIDNGTRDYDDYVKETIALVPDGDRERVREFFVYWYRRDGMPPIEQTWALIGKLKARGYRMYLLSNAPTIVADNLDQIPITALFDGTVVSALIRMHKPDRDIFEYTLVKYGLQADETLFVDDLSENTDGAKAVGIDAYTYSGDADALLQYIETH